MMPWAAAGAAIGSIGAAAVSSAMAPSPSGGGANYYTPTGLGNADQTWQNLLNYEWNNYNGSNFAQFGQQSLQQGLDANSQYGPGYQAAANNAGAGYSNLANILNTQSGQNFGTQNALLGAGQQVFNLGLDPQSALYDRTRQQVTDQSNAVNSAYGLGSSAAGAGMTNQALSNFNIDWQNNQLGRALQGLQGYAGAAGTAGRYGELGTQQASAAPGYTLQGGQLPYTTAQSIASTPGSLANTYGSFLNSNVYGPAEGIQGSIIPYLNYGQGAQSVPFQNATNNANAMGGAVYNGLSNVNWGSLGSAFGGGAGNSSPFSTLYGPTGYGAGDTSSYYSGGGNTYGFTLQ